MDNVLASERNIHTYKMDNLKVKIVYCDCRCTHHPTRSNKCCHFCELKETCTTTNCAQSLTAKVQGLWPWERCMCAIPKLSVLVKGYRRAVQEHMRVVELRKKEEILKR